ncbi:MAG: transketolase [Rhodospirillaceae bacterium]|nr:transketolase [Rhodospirillaceae bacterium]
MASIPFSNNQRSSASVPHSDLANAIRALSMDAVENAKSGHPGMPMGMSDVTTVLFSKFLKFDPKAPSWADRDRFILSAGHGSMLLYSLLYLTGYEDMTLDQIRNFRQLGSRTAGHPEFGMAEGIETTTGPLGQGFANAVGMAIAEAHLAARFGPDLVDHHTYCIAGDGCLMEGISHEAASLAGHLGLSKLIVLFDDNRISIDGPTDLCVSDDQIARFASLGWDAFTVDGHDPKAITNAIGRARQNDKPSLIAAKTTIGYGAPNKEGTAGSHGAPLGSDEITLARKALEWPHPPFEIPGDILRAWREIGARGTIDREAWEGRLYTSGERRPFEAAIGGELPHSVKIALIDHRKSLIADPPKIATRVASQMAIDAIAPNLPSFIGGSADLTGSNNTKSKSHEVLDQNNTGGTYLHYGVREHAMAAAMNGMALHGGIIPYGGTFLVFTDYCRPAIRLAALMRLRVIYVMTHDSIGLGEDGPTHHPVEHLSALRVIPNLNVYRPADAVETAECWEAALAAESTPSVIALSRQGLPQLRTQVDENLSARGGYVLCAPSNARAVTLVATGSEVSFAVEAQQTLEADGIATAVISMPCFEAFAVQDPAYREEVLAPDSALVVIEAGMRQSWDRLLGASGRFVGMDSFGASAPGAALYEHFGITVGAIVTAAKSALQGN